MDEVACLRALQAVRTHGTVTAAAGVLRISPSALSQQVKRLERASGRTLTAPSGRRLVLTPAAHALLDAALPLADDLARVLNAGGRDPARPDRPAEVVGHVRIAAFATALRDHVLTVLARTRLDHPRLTWSLVEMDPDRALPALAAGAVDLAVVHHWRGRPAPVHPGLTLTGAHVDHAEVICRRDDPLVDEAAEGPLAPGRIAARRWVSTGSGSVCHEWLLHMFARHGQRPDVVAEIADFTLHLDVVRHGLAVALVPRMGRPALPEDLVALPLTDAPARVVAAASRSNQEDDPAVLLLRDALLAALR